MILTKLVNVSFEDGQMFVRAGQSGLMYDFFLYSGKNSKKRRLVLVRKLFYGYVKAFNDNRISKCVLNYATSFDHAIIWYSYNPHSES